MKPLVLRTMPLHGQQLIEASAGTGKTYTISHLLLRLVITAQDQLSPEPLAITDILIVTFTRAATQELKDRIREILHHSQAYLEGTLIVDNDMSQIIDDALEKDDKRTLIARCHRAILMLDDAAIFTIHSFCQRILNDFSFSMAQPVEQTLIEDEREILASLMQKVWRERCYPLDNAQALLFQHQLQSPESLLERLMPVLNAAIFDIEMPEQNEAQWGHSLSTLDELWSKGSDLWQEERGTIYAYFEKGIGRSHQKRWVDGWLSDLDAYFSRDLMRYIDWDSSIKFTQSFLDDRLGDKAPQHPLFSLLDDIRELLVKLPRLLLSIFRYQMIGLLNQYKKEHGVVFFDDLIQRVADACSSDALCDLVRKRYPVALIDEFQDTDQWQYRIFNRIYSATTSGLLMIGDPKQAIYSFRGADIHAYFNARALTPADSYYTLTTNFRTAPTLVNQVNHLFSQQSDPFYLNDFPDFIAVRASDRNTDDDCLVLNSEPTSLSVLALSKEENLLKKSDATLLAAEKTASWIKNLLVNNVSIKKRPVQPKDIAILVRKSSQAMLMIDALKNVGINSVFLSKESVLATIEAQALIMLLKAIIEPHQSAGVHKALGDSLIAMDAAAIHALSQDALAWASMQQHFIEAHEIWQTIGFYSAFDSIMHAFDIAETLLSQEQGERRLTNLNQLCDIFIHLELSHLSSADQLRCFEKQCAEASGGEESHKLRLDSEANLVEIVTIHKSKGMEYPVVCCPFVFEESKGGSQQAFTLYNRESALRELYWSLNEKQKKAFHGEQLGEDIRLLYVALTRAQYHLSFCWGNVKGIEKSAMYHLLYHTNTRLKSLSLADLWEPIEALNALIIDDVADDLMAISTEASERNQLSTSIFNRSMAFNYCARSYSAMIKSDSHQYTVIDEEPVLAKDRDEQVDEVVQSQPFETNIFNFPKGSEAGNFMHQVLEDVDFECIDTQLSDVVSHQMSRYHFDQSLWEALICQHLQQCVTKKLYPIGCSLSALKSDQVLKEMGFQFDAINEHGNTIQALLASYREKPVDKTFHNLGGDFKGFIDLIFCYQNKYYVLDYKSNFLGDKSCDYDYGNMHEAIQSHAYDLQYLVYQAALQRYLKSRLPDFDYNKHIGGVFYLFLRGINDHDDSGVYFTRPSADITNAFEALFSEGTP